MESAREVVYYVRSIHNIFKKTLIYRRVNYTDVGTPFVSRNVFGAVKSRAAPWGAGRALIGLPGERPPRNYRYKSLPVSASSINRQHAAGSSSVPPAREPDRIRLNSRSGEAAPRAPAANAALRPEYRCLRSFAVRAVQRLNSNLFIVTAAADASERRGGAGPGRRVREVAGVPSDRGQPY
ncbi:hypothetical protein EVAR_23006_1 [Eumeta japonica]|uniref:Uncharacterized protein n=1 Tax=Eumeta variegata TaxID=151549 RepID=A0A4C1UQ04_EUMVA|nr:hypothetical protein EVAR_23006_1 [Eumeta japonica]